MPINSTRRESVAYGDCPSTQPEGSRWLTFVFLFFFVFFKHARRHHRPLDVWCGRVTADTWPSRAHTDTHTQRTSASPHTSPDQTLASAHPSPVRPHAPHAFIATAAYAAAAAMPPRVSTAEERPQARASSSAADLCSATEIFCFENVSHVRAAHVVCSRLAHVGLVPPHLTVS